MATAANLGGIGIGLLVVGLLALGLVPETVTRPEPRPACRPQQVSVPAASRPVFFAAGAAGGA